MDHQTAEDKHNLYGFKFLWILTEVIGGVLIVAIAIWVLNVRGGLAWTSYPNLMFNWHPLLMTIGLVFLYANGMLIYRIRRNVKKHTLKLIHGGIMIFTLFLTVIGQMAVFNSHNYANPPIPNMYSLHSWVGLTTIILFCCQWVAGMVSFLYPGLQVPLRVSYLPVHVFFGTAGFIGAIASCLLGLTEKAIFSIKDYSDLPREGVLVNLIGLLFVIFGSLTVYLVSQERYRRLPQPEDNLLLTGRND